MDIQTRLVHAGEERIDGAVVLPIFQSSTFVSQDEQDYDAIRYLRLNNTPNHRALHAKLASVCGGEDALVAGSGMAAITTALITVLNSGDHLLIQDCLYGGTHSFVTQDAPDLGMSYDFIAGNAPETWAAMLRPETRAIYVETMTNPLMEVADLEAVVKFAREHGLVSLIDNTFASPCNFRPLEIGFDIELHSATKYLNGHSDIVAGVVVGSAAARQGHSAQAESLGRLTRSPRLLSAAKGLEDFVAENAATRRERLAARTLFDRTGAGGAGELPWAGKPSAIRAGAAAVCRGGWGVEL